MSAALRYEGAAQFRYRLLCSTLSGRPLRIDNIREGEDQPGLKDFEASFLRLLEKVTNGCTVEINVTGTMVRYRPGLITGGRNITHDCGTVRSIGWFLEGILPLLFFAKQNSQITFTGITNDDQDITVDALRSVTIPLMRHFGVDSGLELKIVRRGAPPLGGGQVVLQCPIVKQLKPIDLIDPGRIRRVRGVAYAAKVSPQMCNRMVDAARSVLYPLMEDIFLSTDHAKGDEAGASPGYGLSLVAESTAGSFVSAECMHTSSGQLPEDLGTTAARMLCEEMQMAGFVDSSHQSLMLLLMILCPEDVSRIRLGKLTPFTIQTLRLIRDFFGVQFKIVTEASNKTLQLSCLGVGFKNLARPTQ